MRIKKLLCAALSLLMLLPLASCKTNKGNPDDTTVAPEIVLTLAENGASQYTICRPDKASDDLIKSAKSLATAFKSSTGVTVDFKSDLIADVSLAPQYEILIGDTNRPESSAARGDLKSKDYRIKVIGTKIVIVGGSDQATANAVTKFISDVITSQNGNDKVTFSSYTNLDFNFDYRISHYKIAGNDIKDYSLVIPKNSSASEYRTAVLLQKHISDYTGRVLPIVTDNKADGDKLISIGSCNGLNAVGGDYKAAVNGNTLELDAGSTYSYAALLNYLTDTLFSRSNNVYALANDFAYTANADATLKDGAENILTHSGEIRLMYNNMLGNCDDVLYPRVQRVQMLAELYIDYNPDVLCLQECNPKCRNGVLGVNGIENLLSAAGYAEVKAIDPNKNYTPIFYRADKLTLVQSGFEYYNDGFNSNSKSFTWAVFKTKSTGKQFIVFSTHFCYQGAAEGGDAGRLSNAVQILATINSLKTKYNGIPLLMGGDLNCRVASSAFQKLLSGGGKDAQKLAEKTEDLKTYHTYPEIDPALGIYNKYVAPSGNHNDSAIDHIVIIGDASVKLYDVITDKYALLSSDHCPVYIDFNF